MCGACGDNPQTWKDLGVELISESEAALDTIAANCRSNVISCCSSLFTLWLQRKPDASWGQLIDALRSVKLHNLAAEIEKKLEPPTASTPGDTTEATASQESKIKSMTFYL